jgi:putative colanic acid biosynthesis UDP-glucose lipid carrier transferase
MQSSFAYISKYIVALTDLILVSTVFLISAKFAQSIFGLNIGDFYKYYLLIVNSTWLIIALAFGLYTAIGMENLEKFYRSTFRCSMFHLLFFGTTLLFIENSFLSLKVFIFFYPLLGLGLLLSRFVGTYLQMVVLRKFKVRKSVAIMGNNVGGQKLAQYFNAHEHNYSFEGFLSESDSLLVNDQGELMPSAFGQLQKAVDQNINEVYVSMKPERMSLTNSLLAEAERQCIRIKLVPDLSTENRIPFEMSFMGGLPVLSVRQEPSYEIENRFKKRIFDLFFSSLVIIFLLSWLYPIIAILIKLESPGPVLFKQQRSGRDNKAFWCYKFRSMHVNANSDSTQATKNDTRVTRLGNFMRKTSIDELPQFFNVLQGNMSVVGPRPHMLKHTKQYSEIIEKYMVRQFMKPGITGWAQVNGYRGETKDPSLMERRVAHDIWYMENWTAMLDVKIVFLTVINILTGEENAI